MLSCDLHHLPRRSLLEAESCTSFGLWDDCSWSAQEPTPSCYLELRTCQRQSDATWYRPITEEACSQSLGELPIPMYWHPISTYVFAWVLHSSWGVLSISSFRTPDGLDSMVCNPFWAWWNQVGLFSTLPIFDRYLQFGPCLPLESPNLDLQYVVWHIPGWSWDLSAFRRQFHASSSSDLRERWPAASQEECFWNPDTARRSIHPWIEVDSSDQSSRYQLSISYLPSLHSHLQRCQPVASFSCLATAELCLPSISLILPWFCLVVCCLDFPFFIQIFFNFFGLRIKKYIFTFRNKKKQLKIF